MLMFVIKLIFKWLSLPQNRKPFKYLKEKFCTQFLDLRKSQKILMVKTFLPKTADILNHLKLTPLIIKKLNLCKCIICPSHSVHMAMKKCLHLNSPENSSAYNQLRYLFPLLSRCALSSTHN